MFDDGGVAAVAGGVGVEAGVAAGGSADGDLPVVFLCDSPPFPL